MVVLQTPAEEVLAAGSVVPASIGLELALAPRPRKHGPWSPPPVRTS